MSPNRRVAWVGGVLCLLAALILSSCGGESEPETVQEPVAAVRTPTPDPTQVTPTPEADPTPTPTATPKAPKPYSSQSEGESQFYPDLTFDFDENSVWGEVFDAVAEPERLCIESELDEVVMAGARRDRVLSEGETQPWHVAMFACLAPETAATVFFSRLIADIDDILDEAAEVCLRELLVQTDLASLVAATLPEASGSDAEARTNEFTVKLFECLAQVQLSEDVGQPTESQPPAWRHPTGGWVINAPVVSGGRVFVGSDDFHVYALDAETGELAWRHETGDVVRSTPTVSEGVVYAGSNDGHVYALSVETGDALWLYFTEMPVEYMPLVSGGLVFVGAMSEFGYSVHAVNATSGEPGWIAEVPYPYGAPFAVTVADGVLYAPGDSGELYAMDAATGELAWTFDAGLGAELPPTVVEGVAYLTAVNTAHALDAATGAELWSFGTDRLPARNFPALVADGTYYFSPDQYLYALDTVTGEPFWSFEADAMIDTAPVVGNGMVFVRSESGRFHALDVATGQLVWTWDTPDVAMASPAVVDGVLYAESDDGNLRALVAATGEELWSFQRGYFDGVPSYAVADGMIFLGSLDGAVYAFLVPSTP